MRAAVWTAANQLGVAAGTPAELLTALLVAPRRAARVELPGDDPGTAALARDLRALGRLDVTLHPPSAPPAGTPALPDLSDPEGSAPPTRCGSPAPTKCRGATMAACAPRGCVAGRPS
ncbi:hypothetical protein [Streptomyces sp. CC228A]|uniref:hypothetical protein n=1 Tax=Streptomyces sp. CC228A TaxID=2898186 RepID=UPI001F2C9606|nr:hypothetical protein [Streptomyces sp. CC228A]